MPTTNASKRSLPYAHLLGGLMGRVKGAKADDTDPPEEPKDTDNQDTVDVDELEEQVTDDTNDNSDSNAKGKGKRAKADDDGGTDDASAADGDDDETKDDEEPAGKRARRAENGDDDKDKDTSASAANITRAARKLERARCAAIFGCKAAGTRPDLAAHLAFNTGMSSANAVELLNTAAAGGAVSTDVPNARSGLGARMASEQLPNVGAGSGSGGKATLAQQIIAANDKRLGITKTKQ
jgi:hypothetical protein